MGGFGLTHWLIFAGVAIIVLGGGRFSALAGDMAKGIKSFKKGMAEEDEAKPAGRIEAKAGDPVVDVKAERVSDADR